MNELLKEVAKTLADYRVGEIAPLDEAHVKRWIDQFPAPVREGVLRETAHVLGKAYLPKTACEKFIRSVVSTAKLAGEDPADFWTKTSFLQIQQGGQSQNAMLELIEKPLKSKFGIGQLPSVAGGPYIYLDDVSFSGNRVLNDLRPWIAGAAPNAAHVHIIVVAYHRGGKFYATQKLTAAAKAAGKDIEFTWWRAVEIEDRRQYTDTSDVLRPTVVPNDARVQAYVAGMQYQPVLRAPGSIGEAGFFSSDAGRQLLEQEFLKAGCRIRAMCPNLPARHRPLGFSVLDTLGFGTMIATYRNCPNNAPLALWVGDPWYPLLPRKNN